jgi:formylglycine-generating enzyme required for sulfatase activity
MTQAVGPKNVDREERLDAAVAAYLQAAEAGAEPDRQEWLARHPDLAADLEGFFAGLARLERVAAPLRAAVEPAAVPPGQTLDDFRIVREVGRGGMAVVYEAEQLSLGRRVALKVLPSAAALDPRQLQRFRNEAETVAGLDHPHLVPVHEVGESGGRLFFSMKLLEGGSLAERLERFRDDPRAAARLLAGVARAVHHAHQRGVLHRDLKPSNILLDAEGQPHVSDFGLARRIEGDSDLTQSGALLGTPGYMAPEQARGKRAEVTTASDVYGLGAVLYALLTGVPPFRGQDVLETLTQVRQREPEPPARLNPRVPHDLATVCLKCLHKEPAERYPTALALAEDLERWLAGQPVLARRVGAWGRLLRWCRRNPLVAGLTVTTAALLVVLVAGLSVSIAWIARERTQAVQAREDALAALRREERTRTERALAQVNALLHAQPEAVPGILAGLQPYPDEVRARLEELWRQPEGPGERSQRLRLGLALLPLDPVAVKDRLYEGMLKAREPREMLLVCDALRPYGAGLAEALWRKAEAPEAPAEERFRALVALAAFDPASPRWQQAAEPAVAQLLADPLHLGPWTEALRPVRVALLPPLAEVFRGRRQAEQRFIAATILADFAGDRSEALADLLADADPRQFAVLWPAVQTRREQAVALLAAELHRPPLPAEQVRARETLARRQALAAVALFRLGHPEAAWPLFRHGPDPTRRSYLIPALAPLGADPGPLVARLAKETDVSARRALILSLGEYPAGQLPPEVRQRLTARLLAWYRDDPDAGVHAAIDWLLRQGPDGERPGKVGWRQEDALARIDRELAGKGPDGRRGWYVNGQGHTLAVLAGPAEFLMGSPPYEPGRAPGALAHVEAQHRRPLGRRFAISTKPTTLAQFEAFLRAHPEVRHTHDRTFTRDPDQPILGESWYEAAQYCRWLSEQEGLPKEQMCYPPIAVIEKCRQLRIPLHVPADFLSRTGYRLPTDAEWEYACRAGAFTSRYYGSADELLPHYAWYQANARDLTRPVGRKKPNDFGLFDMLGNACQWCQDRYLDSPAGAMQEEKRVAREGDDVLDGQGRVNRGGGFYSRAYFLRCAYRDSYPVSGRDVPMTFRVARTCR